MIPSRSTLLSDHEAGHVGEVEQWNVEGITEGNKARCFVGRIDKERPLCASLFATIPMG